MDLKDRLHAHRAATIIAEPNLDEMLAAVTAPWPRRRSRTVWTAAAAAATVVVIVLAALVIQSGFGRRGQAAGQDPALVTGIQWRLVAIEPTPTSAEPGAGINPPPRPWTATLSISGSEFVGSDGCNGVSGSAIVTPTTIRFLGGGTQALCYTAVRVGEALDRGTVRWAVAGNTLTLTLPNRHKLIYQS